MTDELAFSLRRIHSLSFHTVLLRTRSSMHPFALLSSNLLHLMVCRSKHPLHPVRMLPVYFYVPSIFPLDNPDILRIIGLCFAQGLYDY